jgi:hypothetical protein
MGDSGPAWHVWNFREKVPWQALNFGDIPNRDNYRNS